MAEFIGNDDFRGYLSYLGGQGDSSATNALNYVGNDGGVDEARLLEFNQAAPNSLDPSTGQAFGSPVLADQYFQQQARDYVTGAFGDFGSGSVQGYNTDSSGSTGTQDDVSYLNDQEAQLRKYLESTIPNTLRDSLTGLGDTYNKKTSDANIDRGRAIEDFNVQREDTTRGKTQAIGQVDTGARTLMDSLRRILGQAGGSSSSAYQYQAPSAVARDASQKRAGVVENYGVNFRNLATSEGRATDDFAKFLEDLEAERKTKEAGIRSSVGSQEQSINEQLANIAGERTRVQGGGYDAIRTAQDPYRANIDSRQSELDNLFSQFRTPSTVAPVQVNTPQLRDYTVDRASINAGRGRQQTQGSPYAQFLNRDKDEERYI